MKANDEGSNLSYLGGKWNRGVRSYDVIKGKIGSKRVPDYIQKSHENEVANRNLPILYRTNIAW